MDGVGAGGGGDREDLADVQVTGGGRVAAERERLVGGADVRRVPVRVGVNRDAGQAGVPAGPGDADRDLAPVGDEDLRYGHDLPRGQLSQGYVAVFFGWEGFSLGAEGGQGPGDGGTGFGGAD